MPIYEYKCIKNDHRFEVIQKMSDEPLQTCQVCDSRVEKCVTAAGFSFQGGGWYKDGYASAPKSDSSKPVETKAASTADSGVKSKESTTTKESKS